MKILILTNNDLASNYALNLLIPKLLSEHSLTLWQSSAVGKLGRKPPALEQLVFFEQRLLSDYLTPLIEKLPHQIEQRFRTFSQLATKCHCVLKTVNNINDTESLAALQALNPDLILSIRYGCILKEQAIAIPNHGILNLHSGILPQYRGVMATFWSMKNSETLIGTTLHRISDASIDTGEIVKISTRPIEAGRSYLWHVLTLYQQGIVDMLAAVNTLVNSSSLPSLRQQGESGYYTFPTDLELQEFEQSGMQLVNEQELNAFLKRHYL
ncbi:formyl transferase [Pseudoalteromonas xiamenensis]